jgi:hypothetical protein
VIGQACQLAVRPIIDLFIFRSGQVERVDSGAECGIVLEGFDSFLSGDTLLAIVNTVKMPKLMSCKETGNMKIVDG